MKLQKFLIFALTSVLAGLAAAFLAINLFQDPEDEKPLQPQPTAQITAPTTGPVSYAAAVKQASPSVVNVYTTKLFLKLVIYSFRH